jgi:hypothetical protein
MCLRDNSLRFVPSVVQAAGHEGGGWVCELHLPLLPPGNSSQRAVVIWLRRSSGRTLIFIGTPTTVGRVLGGPASRDRPPRIPPWRHGRWHVDSIRTNLEQRANRVEVSVIERDSPAVLMPRQAAHIRPEPRLAHTQDPCSRLERVKARKAVFVADERHRIGEDAPGPALRLQPRSPRMHSSPLCPSQPPER